ncbi:unnamed protein product, partial [Trichobilharzia regenti]
MTNSTHFTCPITVSQTTGNASTEDHLIGGGGGGRDNNPCNTCNNNNNTSSIINPINNNPILMNIPSIQSDSECFCDENLSYPGRMCYYQHHPQQQEQINMTNTSNQAHF